MTTQDELENFVTENTIPVIARNWYIDLERASRSEALLYGFTPGGSEYVNDPHRCALHIKERLSGVVEQVQRRKRAEAEARLWKNRVDEAAAVVGNLEAEVARLRDALLAVDEQRKAAEAENKRLREINDILDAKLDSVSIINCQALACSAPVAAEVERLRAEVELLRKQLQMQQLQTGCEGTVINRHGSELPCNNAAVTQRQTWRFGLKEEAAVVWLSIPLCHSCAVDWDEHVRDGEAEARAS
jgi:hypothetical protein